MTTMLLSVHQWDPSITSVSSRLSRKMTWSQVVRSYSITRYVVCLYVYLSVCLAFCIQVHAVVGVLNENTDPMVNVMKLEKAPQGKPIVDLYFMSNNVLINIKCGD